jgi:cell division protease FtsH
MDGFKSSRNVIVIGATNRIDVLDQAPTPGPLRPPRRSYRRRTGRDGGLFLEVHTRDVPLAPDVDIERIAATTPGMFGADFANLVNEAALLAARLSRDEVETADFTPLRGEACAQRTSLRVDALALGAFRREPGLHRPGVRASRRR